MYLVTTEQFEVDGELFYEGVSWKDYRKKTDIKNSIKYGRLYNGYAASDERKIAPPGWHVPTMAEWSELYSNVGGAFNLREVGNKHWVTENDSIDSYGFSLLPGGMRQYGVGFVELGNTSICMAYYDNEYINVVIKVGYIGSYTIAQNSGISIRLIKDDNINNGDIIIDGDIYNSITIGNQVWLKQNLATRHYQNGDLIGSDFSGTVGAVISYNNDETNVYETTEIESDNFIITYNGIDYIIAADKAIETPRFTREQNIPFGEYQYRTHSDKTTEYFESAKEYFGIDMKENYAAQFRDGMNPHKDENGSIFKENPDQ